MNKKARKQVIVLILLIVILFGCWVLTVGYGTVQVRASYENSLRPDYENKIKTLNVFRDEYPRGRNVKWFYIRTYSPLPFLVVADYGTYRNLKGHGGTTYWVWFPGVEYPVTLLGESWDVTD